MDSKSDKRKQQKIFSNLGKAINKYNLLSDGDRIMIGVSGGKDSMTLLSALATRRTYGKENYDIVAVHIDVENVPYSIDEEYIDNFCQKHNIKFISEKISVDFEQDPKKSHCFVCSWHRRKRLFELTNEHNCNKLALGHHMDDALETLIINMSYHGCISSMPAKLDMFNGKIQLIRPLILLTNNEIASFAKMMGFPSEKENCPYEDKTKRSQAGEVLKEMEKRFGSAKKSLFKSMSKIQTEYLPVEDDVNPVIDSLNIYNKSKK